MIARRRKYRLCTKERKKLGPPLAWTLFFSIVRIGRIIIIFDSAAAQALKQVVTRFRIDFFGVFFFFFSVPPLLLASARSASRLRRALVVAGSTGREEKGLGRQGTMQFRLVNASSAFSSSGRHSSFAEGRTHLSPCNPKEAQGTTIEGKKEKKKESRDRPKTPRYYPGPGILCLGHDASSLQSAFSSSLMPSEV